MRFAKTAFLIIAVLMLCSCGANEPTATVAPTDRPSSTPPPLDVPIYQNSFEGNTDSAASGIKSNGKVTLNTDNFNYPGPGTALEIKGSLPGTQGASLYVDLSVKELTGIESVNLSNKTIYFSIFIPKGSPIERVAVSGGKDGDFTPIVSGDVSDDPADYWAKGVWHNYRYVLTYATNVYGYFDTLRIGGERKTNGAAAETSFLVDDLKWIGVDVNHIPVDESVDSLRKYAANQHFQFGMWADPRTLLGDENDPFKNKPWVAYEDPWVAYLNVQEGTVNTIWGFYTAENEDLSQFDYNRPEDAGLIKASSFGEGNSMTPLGYGVGCTFSSVTPWMQNLTFPEQAQALLLYAIEKNLRFTQGQKPIWLLFNEFTLWDEYGGNGLKYRQEVLTGLNGSDFGPALHYMPWAASPTDSSLIEAAFIKAHETDPEAILLLNEGYNAEQIGLARGDFLYQFASSLKAKGIPIDGVGFQLHALVNPQGEIPYYVVFSWPWQFDHWDLEDFLGRVDQNVARYETAGLKVAFTEVDVSIKIDDLDLTTPEGRAEYENRLQWQTKYYAGLMKIAIEHENVILYHTWGVSDRWPEGENSFFPGYGDMHLFDKNFNPKPAYFALLEMLKNP